MRQKGTVKWWSVEKGYGFIKPDMGGKDVFCHFTGIRGSGRRNLEDGETVEFEIELGEKGPQAVEVSRAA
jgi:CspA family cold shock protein